MRSMPIRILLVLFVLILIYPSSLPAATEQRIALVIGNSAYSYGSLKNPVNDATAIADMLKKLGFTVTLIKNAKQQEMDESIREFGRQLKSTRGVGLFYYAGHGMQIGGVNYLLPVNARIEKESDVRFHSINADMVLAEMENAENGLNIVLLDACRDNPFYRSFRDATRGLAIISNAPSGTFISYSTGANQVARDGEGKNSPYTRALLENIDKPGLSINNIFMRVRSQLKKETGQIPWELSSLESNFYFVAGEDEEQHRLKEEKALLEKKKALEEQWQKIEKEKNALEAKKGTISAMAKPPEAKNDGRFIDNGNGTVTDKKTGLMWAAKDNGSDINWQDAKNYCDNYRGGGYTDWRMPTLDELAELYDNGKAKPAACGKAYTVRVATNLIDVTCYYEWSSKTRWFLGSGAAYIDFLSGDWYWFRQSSYDYIRALPVRSGK